MTDFLISCLDLKLSFLSFGLSISSIIRVIASTKFKISSFNLKKLMVFQNDFGSIILNVNYWKWIFHFMLTLVQRGVLLQRRNALVKFIALHLKDRQLVSLRVIGGATAQQLSKQDTMSPSGVWCKNLWSWLME